MWIFVSGRSRSPRRKCVGEFYGPEAQSHKGFPALFSTYFEFRRVVHRMHRRRPQRSARRPQRTAQPVDFGAAPSAQPGVTVVGVPRLAQVHRLPPRRTRRARKWEKGPRRYELQGPFRWGAPRASPWPSPSTGTGDAPDRSSRLLRPRWPRHLASAVPLPASWAATVWIFVSGRSRSPRRKCVRRVLRPGSPAPQGFPEISSDILGFPACRPQPGRPRSTDRPLPSTGFGPTCGRPAWTSRVRNPRSRTPPRPPATVGRPRTAQRSGPRPASRPWCGRPAPRSPGSR